jgi:hypothetical protein
LARKGLLFLGQECFQALLRNRIQQSVHLLAGPDPAANGFFQSMGNIDHFSLPAQTNRQTQSRVSLPLLAAAAFLTASSLHFDQAATEQRAIGDPLDRLGAGIAFLGGAMRP